MVRYKGPSLYVILNPATTFALTPGQKRLIHPRQVSDAANVLGAAHLFFLLSYLDDKLTFFRNEREYQQLRDVWRFAWSSMYDNPTNCARWQFVPKYMISLSFIVIEKKLVLSLTWLPFLLVRFRLNPPPSEAKAAILDCLC